MTDEALAAARAEIKCLIAEIQRLISNAKAQGILDDLGAAGKSRAAQIRKLAARIGNQRRTLSQQLDTIEGLTADLESAIEVAFKRGAREWVRLNYPAQFEKLSSISPEEPKL